jgi:hypothetical protein
MVCDHFFLLESFTRQDSDLRCQLARTTDLLDLLLSTVAEELGLHNERNLREVTLAQDLEVALVENEMDKWRRR